MDIEQQMNELRSLVSERARAEARMASLLRQSWEAREEERRRGQNGPLFDSLMQEFREESDWVERVAKPKIRELSSHLQSASVPSLAQRIELARLMREQGHDSSTFFERRVEEFGPRTVADFRELSAYYAETSRLPDAIRITRQGLVQFNDGTLRHRLADLLERAGETDELLKLLRADLEASPDDVQIRHQLADLLERAGEAYELLELLRADLEASPDDLQIRQRIAKALLWAERVDDARSFLDAEVDRHPRDESLHEYRQDFLVEALLGDDYWSRQVAVSFLQEHQEDLAVKRLGTRFEQSDDGQQKRRILQALVEIRGSGATPFLLTALQDRQPEVRSYAVQALARVSDSGVLQPIVQAFRTEADLGVREHIAQALRTLDPGPGKWWEKLTGRRPWAR